jgi:hypothetical protein
MGFCGTLSLLRFFCFKTKENNKANPYQLHTIPPIKAIAKAYTGVTKSHNAPH